jgi:hypothetical protein
MTQGSEQAAGARLAQAQNPGDAAAIVSSYYERPLARELNEQLRAQTAQAVQYVVGQPPDGAPGSSQVASADSTATVPVVAARGNHAMMASESSLRVASEFNPRINPAPVGPFSRITSAFS